MVKRGPTRYASDMIGNRANERSVVTITSIYYRLAKDSICITIIYEEEKNKCSTSLYTLLDNDSDFVTGTRRIS